MWDLPYGEPNTVDPANGAYYSASLVTDQLCDTLVRPNPDYSVAPDLAASWKQVDPKTLVFNLRPGVHFWDGHPLTSTDVVYSLQHAFSPNSAIGSIFSSVKSVVATGPYQVTLHFSQPDELVLREMPGFASSVFEKAQAVRTGSKFGSAEGGIMCSGPYELKSWTPGTSIVMTANPNYWDPTRRPHIHTITFTFATNSTTLAESLLSGQTDGAYEVPAETIPRLSTASTGRLLYGFAPLYLSLSPARPDGPLASLPVREALFTSIDRRALAHVVYHDAATPNFTLLNTRTWDPSGLAQYQAAYAPYAQAGATWGTAQALTAGKKLVAASGYHGQPIVLATLAGDETINEVAQLIQQQAKLVGLNVAIRPLQPIQYSNATISAKARQGTDLLLAVSFNGADDPLEPLGFDVLPGSVFNYSNYSDPKVTQLLTEARQTYDPAARAALIIRAQSIYEKQWLGGTLLNLDEISFLNHRLSGAVTSFPYMLMPSLASVGRAG
jgi:peptide/nickel transport system substrate-binding protein